MNNENIRDLQTNISLLTDADALRLLIAQAKFRLKELEVKKSQKQQALTKSG